MCRQAYRYYNFGKEKLNVSQIRSSCSSSVFVAELIFANFIASALQAQILPDPGTTGATVFAVFEWFFNISFTIELVWNMYGSW